MPVRHAAQLSTDTAAPNRRAITRRSIVLGSLAVVLVCAVTPFNDFVVANTFFVGSYLPLAMVLVMFVLATVVNAGLYRLAPRRALGTGELAVVLAMLLIGCGLPSQGLLRSWLPMLVGPFRFGRDHPRFWALFNELGLPAWMFPVSPIADGRSDPVMLNFYGRLGPGEAIPWGAWVVPLAGWGVFLVGLFAALLGLAWLLRTQWAENERLPFPIAQLQLSLIEAPRPGRALNDLFRSPGFWVAAGTVFFLQSWSALHTYLQQYFPEIPLGYNLHTVLSEEPFRHLDGPIKQAVVYFTFVGVAYFIQSRTAFSLWAVYVIERVGLMVLRTYQTDVPGPAWQDQHFGSCAVYVLGIAWVGRAYWRRVLRDTVTRLPARAAAGLPSGRRRGAAAEHRAAVVAIVGGLAVMLAWLLYVGVGPAVACLIVGVIVVAHVVTGRVVAETGLAFFRAQPTVWPIITNMHPTALSLRETFFAGAFTMNGAFHTRESVMTFAQHGLRVADEADVTARERRQFVGLFAWALALGFVVATASSLWCYYNYATPISMRTGKTVINDHSLLNLPRQELVDPLTRRDDGRWPPKGYSSVGHLAGGAAVTVVLQALTWRFAWWPFQPVGYVVSTGVYAGQLWFSLFLGWLAKVLILRFGGAQLFRQC
ncbi:MAG TPA: DUF6785 family protein, partial [Tepidisphaeraceae bacterium]|nr:DUF6785 family protein [Tepidisphaeraceae bacterium]